MDAAVVERVVELRALLADAQVRVGDRSVIGRHAALLLLDGACEYAMSLAYNELGMTRRRDDTFPKTLQNLRNALGNRWSVPGMQGISDLHETRNLAQHRGVRVDPTELPRWAADAERFIGSLVQVTFNIALEDVTLAALVTTAEVAVLLTEAEQALAVDDPTRSFKACLDAFGVARSRWLVEREDGLMPRRAALPHELGLQDVQRVLDLAEDYAQVTPFAADLGEYVWLRNLEQSVQQGAPPSAEDARRALNFVFGWVLRWEAFSARYTPNRYLSWLESIRPPKTGQDHALPVITEVSVEPHNMAGSWFRVTFQLADAPDDREDFRRWLSAMGQELERTGGTDKVGGTRIRRAWIERDGKVIFDRLAPDANPHALADSLTGQLDHALAKAAASLREPKQPEGEDPEVARARHNAEMAPYRAALLAVQYEGAALFSGVHGARFVERTRTALRIEATVRTDLSPLHRHALERAFRQNAGPEYHLILGRGVSFSADNYSPERCAEIASEAARLAKQLADLEHAQQTELEHVLAACLANRRDDVPRQGPATFADVRYSR